MPDPGITNPGIPNFNLEQVFESFGYTPTQAEIDALAPAFSGTYNMGEIGSSAIANYVQAMNQLLPAEKAVQGNLLSEQQASTMSQSLGKILEQSGTDAYNAAANIFTKAPQLFGSLTPDQITQYLAPVTAQTQETLGQIEGGAAQRGLAGSSLEAQALAQEQARYQENVLSQGLGVGQEQQRQQAAILQALGGQQFGAGQQQFGLGATYAGLANQSAGQYGDIATTIAGLPSQFTNQALAQNAAAAALRPQNSSPLAGLLGTGLGIGAGALLGGPMGAYLGANLGGQIGSSVSGNPTGVNLGGTAGNSILLASLLGKNQFGGLLGGGGGGTQTPNYTSGLATPVQNANYSQYSTSGTGLGGPLTLGG